MKKIVNYFDLTGLNIFITGSSGHLGKEMALCLAKAGAHIYLNGRTKSKLLKIQSAFKKKVCRVQLHVLIFLTKNH